MVEIGQWCRLMEKQKYWGEFEPTKHQFFKIMIDDFRSQLRIPRKYVINFKEKMSNTIQLRGPSGYMWTVKRAQIGDDVLLKNGWEKFVEDHRLAKADLLVFQYDGNSSFKVTIFDKSGCEREGSYFVKEHTSSCSANGCAMQNNGREESIDEVALEESEDELLPEMDGRCGRQEKLMLVDEDESETPSGVRITLSGYDRKKKRRIQNTSQVYGMKKLQHFKSSGQGQEHSQSYKSIQLGPKTEQKEKPSSSALSKVKLGTGAINKTLDQKTYKRYYISKRRPVSEDEKKRAYESALAHSSTRPFFMSVMKPTNVCKFFTLNIPRDWAAKHMPVDEFKEVQLRVPPNSKKWTVTYKRSPCKFVLGKGWSKFVLENNLEEDDVCIFELNPRGKPKNDTVVLYVKIFRVVEEVAPLTEFTISQSKRSTFRN